MDAPNLKSPEFYLNRELSFLEFNQRVLEQAKDESLPLLERVKFLAISCSNLDEFFEIRVSGLKQRLELGSTQAGPDPLTIPQQLAAIHERIGQLLDEYHGRSAAAPALRDLDNAIRMLRLLAYFWARVAGERAPRAHAPAKLVTSIGAILRQS